MRNQVTVLEINASKSENQMILKLEQSASTNSYNTILDITQGVRKRVAYVPMEKSLIEKFGITEDCDINALFEELNVPEVRLVVTESLEPRTWLKDGVEVTQEPKRKGKDGAIMYHKGQPIYRNCTLDLATKEDILLEADKAVVADKQSAEKVELPF